MKIKHHVPQYLAEFIGTYFLVFFGCGSVILFEMGQSDISTFVPLIFGGTISIMIYATGHISGAHFNPAVTFAFWIAKRFPAARIPGYVIAQCTGATLASLTHLLIWGAEHSFGVTFHSLDLGTAFFVEVLLSFVLMFVIISVATDSRAVGEMAGIAIGTTVVVCAFVGGPLTGASMNPARSIGPALISGQLSGLWLYLLAPLLGTFLGAKTYEWIRCNREGDDDKHGCC